MIRWIAGHGYKLSILYFVVKNRPPWKRGTSLEAIESEPSDTQRHPQNRERLAQVKVQSA